MPEVSRIEVREARQRVTSGQALLVCAYEDERCQQIPLEGSILMPEFQQRVAAAASLPREQEIIFYCA